MMRSEGHAYTGHMTSTPSSLMWLIRKYSRREGEKQRHEEGMRRALIELSARRLAIRQLNQELRHIKAVMRMHEVRVDPRDLKAIRPHRQPAVLEYGGITRTAFRTLRQAQKNTATTREIVAAVFNAMPKRPEGDDAKRITERVRIRLCIMARQGMITRLPRSNPSQPCCWQLPAEPAPSSPGAAICVAAHRDSRASSASTPA